MSTFKPHPDIKKIPEDFRRRWAEALRTSNQQKWQMSDKHDTSHCCLCVAARLEGARIVDYVHVGTPSQIRSVCPISAMIEGLYIAHDSAGFPYDPASLNDRYLTHPQIADLLDGKEVTI